MFEQLSKALADETKLSAREYSPLVLAFMGDAVFELCVRAKLVKSSTAGVNALNKQVQGFVNAAAQAQMAGRVKEHLNEEELAVFTRGRNAKTNSSPKNAPLLAYKHATGLEALFGYLFLKGDYGRLLALFQMCVANNEERNQT